MLKLPESTQQPMLEKDEKCEKKEKVGRTKMRTRPFCLNEEWKDNKITRTWQQQTHGAVLQRQKNKEHQGNTTDNIGETDR